MELMFTIPGRGVSVNRLVNAVGGKLVKSKESRDEKTRIRAYIFQAMQRAKWEPIKWYETEIVIFNSLADLDNLFKGVCDAMKGTATLDDRYHLHTDTKKVWDDEGPRIQVTIRPADPVAYGRSPDRATHGTSHATKQRKRRVPDGRHAHLPPMVARVLGHARTVPKLP